MRHLPLLAAGLVVAMAVAVLLGWAADIRLLRRFHPDWSAMQPMTAVSMALAGSALWAFALRRRRLADTLALLLAVIPVGMLLQHATGLSLGIDTLLFPDLVVESASIPSPGRMSVVTAICLLGFSVLLLAPRDSPRRYRRMSCFATLAMVPGLLAIAANLFDGKGLSSSPLLSISLPSALALVLLFAGGLLALRNGNWLRRLVSQTPGSRLARRMLFQLVGWPVVLALILPAIQHWLGDGTLTLPIYIVMLSGILIVMVLRFARRLDRAESDRRGAEASLRASEQRYLALFNNTTTALVHQRLVTDPQGRPVDLTIEAVNSVYERILERPREEIVGRRVTEAFPRVVEAHPWLIARLGKVALEGREDRFELDLTGLGKTISLYLYCSRPGECTGLFTDITAQRRAQQALQQSEEILRATFEQAVVGIAHIDPDGRFFRVNAKLCDMLDYREEELLGKVVFDIAYPPDREIGRAEFAASLRGELPSYTLEKRYQRRDGEVICVRIAATSVLDRQSGRIRFHVALIEDISAQKENEAVLRRERSRLQSILDNSPVIITMKDMDSRYVLANQALFRNVETVPPERLLGHTVLDIYPAEIARPLMSNDRAVIERDGPVEFEEVVRHQDGSAHTYMSVKFPVHDIETNDLLGICSISTDITERKAAEREIQRLNADLERRVGERTADLGKSNEVLMQANMELQHFAHATAHDLQTPLRSMVSFTQLAQQAFADCDSPQGQAWLGRAVDEGRRLQELIGSLLSYTRLDAQGLPFADVDMNILLSEVLVSMDSLIANSGAEVRVEALPTVTGDRTQLRQVVQNLVENGIKYNETTPPRIRISCAREGDEWVFSVADNGIGIPPEQRERIFGIFKRLHAYHRIPGFGIGLAICKRIVERHGGRIWAESEPGNGSTLRFALPVDGPKRGGDG